LDKLSHEAILLTNLYASGNRTVRGMEAVLCSFPPLPGDSVVVRSGDKPVETLARVLKRDGYENTFIYAGRGLFDHVRSFMTANGYDRFIEQKDFDNPQFSTIWGVCNEDLYNRGIEECRKANDSGKPFLLTMLSVSNHKPFTYPKGRIPENPDDRSRENAVKYTDYAIGQFFKNAKKEKFWTNTVFVVVADHGARVYGQQTIPMESYEIPCFIFGPAVVEHPKAVGIMAGQVDISPTLLGLIGRPYLSSFFGRDIFKIDPSTGRTFLNHNRDIGLFENGRMVVLGLNKTSDHFAGDPKHGAIVAMPDSPEFAAEDADTVALFQVANDLYLKNECHISETELTEVPPRNALSMRSAPLNSPR
jgi:phosphoglycerol transferase MdoB-like AlkP superfamily enzyme